MSQNQPPSRRVSLACVPCRSKHLRCDATSPVCARCRTEGLQCVYMKSRRGGRRTRHAEPKQPLIDVPYLRQQSQLPSFSGSEPLNSQSAPDDDSSPSDSSNGSLSGRGDPVTGEQFIGHYYAFFHSAHPCVLPQWALKQRLAINARPLQALVAVIQYIGSVFAKSAFSASLKLDAEQAVSSIGNDLVSGFDVQAVLMLSIAIYWQNEPEKALKMLDRAIELALELGMQTQQFASVNGNNDPLLEECWRRTWWQIYMTDAHIAGSTSTFPFRTSNVEMSADLPCDEAAYNAGNTPPPRTLADYDMREFLDDEDRNFSSFAEMVGLTRGLGLALSTRQGMTSANAPSICANADASVTAWRALLHPSKKDILRKDGTVDELLFKASMIIQTYIVELHRQLSSLSYSPIEAVAHCSPSPPPESLRGCNSPECQLHTAKVLRAIDQFNELLILPTNILTHTPFIICMISNLVIAHLAACRFHYQGDETKLARERIRLSMGALKTVGEYWPMGQRTYRELGIIAREILGLRDKDNRDEPLPEQAPINGEVPRPLSQPIQTEGPVPGLADVPDFMGQPPYLDLDLLDANFDFCGLFDMNLPAMAVV